MTFSMSIWNDAAWMTVGGYYAAQQASANRKVEVGLSKVDAIVASLIDKEMQAEIRKRVYDLDMAGAEETWVYLECFKRDNPHLLYEHWGLSHWESVGKVRFSITEEEFLVGKKRLHLTNEEKKVLAMSRGQVVTLLMNTYGRYSEMEAIRKAGLMIHGEGSASWTLEHG